MSVYELTRDQLVQLKQRMLTDEADENGEGVSWGELADADSLVDDKRVFDRYDGTDFTEGDFG